MTDEAIPNLFTCLLILRLGLPVYVFAWARLRHGTAR